MKPEIPVPLHQSRKTLSLRKTAPELRPSHVTAMHNYDNDYAFKLISILAKSGISVITNPFDNTYLMNRNDRFSADIRVDELHARGVNVSIIRFRNKPWYLSDGDACSGANLLFAHRPHDQRRTGRSSRHDHHKARRYSASAIVGITEGMRQLVISAPAASSETLRLMPEANP